MDPLEVVHFWLGTAPEDVPAGKRPSERGYFITHTA